MKKNLKKTKPITKIKRIESKQLTKFCARQHHMIFMQKTEKLTITN